MDNRDLKRGDLVQFNFSTKSLNYNINWSLIKSCDLIPTNSSELWSKSTEVSMRSSELQGQIAELLNPIGNLVYIPALDLYTAGIPHYVLLETRTTYS